MSEPSTPFFAILSRHFVTAFLAQLSKPAVHVYSYLRTWCTSKAGQASGWVDLRVRTIAAAIGRCDRHVRRALAELRGAALIESREVYVDGARRANRWRVLPEPGFPVEAPPEEPSGKGPPPPVVDVAHEVEVVVAEEAAAVVAALPEWVEEAVVEAERAVVEAQEARDDLASDPEVWGEPGSERRERSEAAARGWVESAKAELAAIRVAAADPRPSALLRAERWWSTVVSTIGNRAVRRLVRGGMSQRKASNAVSRGFCERAIRAHLLESE